MAAWLAGCGPASHTARSIDPETAIETWEIRDRGVVLRLTQILPDQVRGFYYGRGFDTASVERIAIGACVFQTVLRNESARDGIRFDLREWRALQRDRAVPLRLDADWQREWEARKIPSVSRMAFRYALFPTAHEYQVGDWNMGMTLYPLPLGSTFDLHFAWSSGGRRFDSVLRGVRCASDGPREKS